MTRTKKHERMKPCDKSCPICYPVARTAKKRRQELRAEERKR